jgi:TetR/AcrR family fatty acid metabolism transcriptional regulator
LGRNGKATAESLSSREADRRRTILRAAIEVFAKKGYHGCRIADVAREAGVAYGLVYHYFHNKEQLLSSVFESAWSHFVERVREAAEGDGPLEEKVRRISGLAFEAYRLDPRAVRVLILEIARSPASARINRGTAFVEVIRMSQQMFERARRRGELRQDTDTLVCAALLFGAIEMGLTAFVLGLVDPKDATATERAATQVADAFLRGVLAAPAAEMEWKSKSCSTKSKALRRD